MKKLIYIVIFFFITNCGFEPIYVEKSFSNFTVKSFKMQGDKKINKKINNLLSLRIDKNKKKGFDLELNSRKLIESVAKDSVGNTTKYKTTIYVDLLIKNSNNVKKSKKFDSSFSYNNQDNNFDLLQYQKNIENNLINKLVSEIKIFLDAKNDN
jgi:hypothetical protein